MAAEGAILNEMLEIVKKRAALRPSDTMVGSDGGYEVSEGCSTRRSDLHENHPNQHPTPPLTALDLMRTSDGLDRTRLFIGCGACFGAVVSVVVFAILFYFERL